LDGQIWALKADSLTSPLIVTVTVTDNVYNDFDINVLHDVYH